MHLISGWKTTLLAALVLAAAATFADLVWVWIPGHRPIYGLIHGALLFMIVGVVLGLIAARAGGAGSTVTLVGRAAGGELLAGLAGAAAFYALYGLIGWAAMFVAWMWIWMLTAFLQRWVRSSPETLGTTLVRGVAAAILSGIAFWAISGIWLGAPTRTPNYAVNFLSWFIAFLPGFACLLLEKRSAGDTDL